MTDLARVAIVGGVLVAALVLAWWARTLAARRGSPIDVTGLMQGPAVIVFTKDDCANCAAALELVEGLGLPVRQIRAEEEPRVLKERTVSAVPVTVVIDGSGRTRGQFGGVPSKRALDRAAGRAREIPEARPPHL